MSMPGKWKKVDEIVHIHSKWMDLYCETWDLGADEVCEYWRVEKADSVIVVSMYEDQFILPKPMFRPGVGRNTLDFPGGRVDDSSEKGLIESSKRILKKELSVREENIAEIRIIDGFGKIINSSFNNQRVFVVYARINELENRNDFILFRKEITDELLEELNCLQCYYALTRLISKDK